MTWAFEFEDQPYFAGFRVLSTNGIELPVLNVFRMFGMMGGRRVASKAAAEVGLEAIRNQGVRSRPDVSAIACKQDGKVCVLIWNFHDEDVPGPSAEINFHRAIFPMRASQCFCSISASIGNTATPTKPGSDWDRRLGRLWSNTTSWSEHHSFRSSARRNGFEREMGSDASLFPAAAGVSLIALDGAGKTK